MGTATIKGTTSGIGSGDSLVGIEIAWTTDSGALTTTNAPAATNRAVLTSEVNTTGLTGLTAGIGKVFTGQDLTNFTTATGITFSTGSDTSDGNYYCYSRIWEKNGSTYQVSEWTTNGAIPSNVRITSVSKPVGRPDQAIITFSANDAVSFDLFDHFGASAKSNIISPETITSVSSNNTLNQYILKAINGAAITSSDEIYIIPFNISYGSIPTISNFSISAVPTPLTVAYSATVSCATGTSICGHLISDNPNPPSAPYTDSQNWARYTGVNLLIISGNITSSVGVRPVYVHILRDDYTIVSFASADATFAASSYDQLNGFYSYGNSGGGIGNFGPVQLNLVGGQVFEFDYSAVMTAGWLYFTIVRDSDSVSVLDMSLNTNDYEIEYDESGTVSVTIPTSGLYNISWGLDWYEATELYITNFTIPEA